MRTATFVGLFVVYKLGSWLWQTEMDARAIRQAFAWQAFEIGTYVDAHALIDGRLPFDEFERRSDERMRSVTDR